MVAMLNTWSLKHNIKHHNSFAHGEHDVQGNFPRIAGSLITPSTRLRGQGRMVVILT